MNKLYLLAALAAAAYGAVVSNEDEADTCDADFVEEEDGDWGYSWTIELDIGTPVDFYDPDDGADDDEIAGVMCY